MLERLKKEFEGELTVKFVDVSTLDSEDADLISTVPFYKLLAESGAILELWNGTKNEDQMRYCIANALDCE